MDIDELRKNLKNRKVKNDSRKFESSSKSTTGSQAYAGRNSENNFEESSIVFNEDSEDLTIAYTKDDFIYVCVAETGQKIKISLSQYRGKDIQTILNQIASLNFTVKQDTSSDLPGYNFAKNHIQQLKEAHNVFILCPNNLKGYVRALEINSGVNAYRGTTARIVLLSHMGCEGKIAMLSLGSQEVLYDYNYKNCVVRVEYGDGVIEIKEDIPTKSYVIPSLYDIINGIITNSIVREGIIKDFLALDIFPVNMSINIKDRGKILYNEKLIGNDYTIPGRKSYEYLGIKDGQCIEILFNNKVVTKEFTPYFDKIEAIEYPLSNEPIFYVSKDGMRFSVSLYNIIAQHLI